MFALLWAALGFFVLAAAGGGALLGIRAWRAWQAFTSLAAGAGAGAERLGTRVEEVFAHAAGTAGRVDELAGALERLRASTGRVQALVGATDEVRSLVGAVRAFVPR